MTALCVVGDLLVVVAGMTRTRRRLYAHENTNLLSLSLLSVLRCALHQVVEKVAGKDDGFDCDGGKTRTSGGRISATRVHGQEGSLHVDR
jgi:hypothetical protein